MTDRYAFRYNEFKIKQIEQNKLFWSTSDLPLLSDIAARMSGLMFDVGSAPLSFLGIRVALNDDNLMQLENDADDYGVDALRVVLLENKLPLSHEQKTAGWRLADSLWLKLRQLPLGSVSDIENTLFYPFIDAVQKRDFKKAWIALKTVLNNQVSPVCAYCLYPFMPHLVQSIHSDIHSKMAEFWSFMQNIELPSCYFIEVNGSFIEQFYISDTSDFEKIKKEALSFPLVQNKINGKEIKKVIHITGKGLNFVI